MPDTQTLVIASREEQPAATAERSVATRVPPSGPSSRVCAAWPALRALVITAALIITVLSALPSEPFDAARLARPTHARNVRGLVATLRGVGVPATRADVEHALIALSTPVVAVRNALIEPLAPVFDLAQMGQRWGLFLQTGRTAYRIRIDGRGADGGYRLLYRPHDVDVLKLAPTLTFRRLRGLYNPAAKGMPREQFEGFVSWLAATVFARHPELHTLRVRVDRLRLGSVSEPNRWVDVAHESVRERGPAS